MGKGIPLTPGWAPGSGRDDDAPGLQRVGTNEL